MGACLADREDADPELLDPEFYSSRAKALLDIEMDSPTVATVQALVIMSATEAAFTRDSRGWLYSGGLTLHAIGFLLSSCGLILIFSGIKGMAARLSADLGLHLDIAEQARHGLLSPRDLHIRQTAYQGVYIHERF